MNSSSTDLLYDPNPFLPKDGVLETITRDAETIRQQDEKIRKQAEQIKSLQKEVQTQHDDWKKVYNTLNTKITSLLEDQKKLRECHTKEVEALKVKIKADESYTSALVELNNKQHDGLLNRLKHIQQLQQKNSALTTELEHLTAHFEHEKSALTTQLGKRITQIEEKIAQVKHSAAVASPSPLSDFSLFPALPLPPLCPVVVSTAAPATAITTVPAKAASAAPATPNTTVPAKATSAAPVNDNVALLLLGLARPSTASTTGSSSSIKDHGRTASEAALPEDQNQTKKARLT